MFVGRPVIWANACAGQEGIVRMLGLLRDELVRTMKLCGVNKVSDITEKYVINLNAPKPRL